MPAREDTILRPPEVGDPAPTFTLPTLDGGLIALEDALRDGRFLLLVFLRHPG
jgi:peroxiredoxin